MPEHETRSQIGGHTGQVAPKSGEYRCEQHPEQTITLDEGERFPPCPAGRHGANWLLVPQRGRT